MNKLSLALGLTLGLLFSATLPTSAALWTLDTDGNWNTDTNWDANADPFPDAIGASAEFDATGNATQTITLTAPVTLGSITNNQTSNNYTIAGSSITFDNGGSGATLLSARQGGPGFAIDSNIALNDDLSVTILSGAARNVFLNGAISGTNRTLTHTGVGRLFLKGDNSFTGSIVVEDGTLNLEASSGQAAGAISQITVGDGSSDAQLNINQANQINDSATVVVKNGATLGGNTETIANLTVESGGAYTRGTGASQTRFTDTLTVSGGAALTMSDGGAGATGGIRFEGSSATLVHDGSGSSEAVVRAILDGDPLRGVGRFDLGDTDRTWTVNDSASAVEIDVRANLNGDAGIGFELTGGGTVKLSHLGGNIYSGTTTVTSGTLLVSNADDGAGPGSGTGTGAVSVGAGGTLGGNGFIEPGASNDVTIAGSLAPGESIGTLTFDLGSTTGGVSLTTGSTLDFELGAPGTSDELAFWDFNLGDLTLTDVTLNLSDAGGLAAGTYTLMSFFSDDGTISTAHSLSGGISAINGPGAFDYTLDYASDPSLIQLQVTTVIPEPSAVWIMFAGAAVLLFSRRRSHP